MKLSLVSLVATSHIGSGIGSWVPAPRAGDVKHIDSTEFCCHAAIVRTTVTLDPDVERMLRERVRLSRKSFKQVLNNAVREGLRKDVPPGARPQFVVKARPMFLRAGIDPARLSEIADDLEVEAFLRTSRRLQRLEDDTRP